VDGALVGVGLIVANFSIPEFQREHDGVSGETEFSKRTKKSISKTIVGGGGWMGPIPEFQSEHGVLGLRRFSKLTNCQISKTMGT
jgi:hypothetical protein